MPPSSNDNPLRRLQSSQRQQLLTTEQTYTNAIRGAFNVVRTQLAPHVAVFTDAYSHKLTDVRAQSGNPLARVPSTWLSDRTPAGGNVAALQRFVQVQIDGFGVRAQALIQRGQRATAGQGNDDAGTLLHAAVAPAAHLVDPNELVQTARGEAKQQLVEKAITSGTKLNTLLGGLGAEAGDRVHKNLLQGLAAGVHPRQVADLIYTAVGRSASRALTIARTELIGAYRDAALDNYRRNDDVVQQWVWSAELLGCCPLCAAMNGTVHSLDEPMDSHACCRCAALPLTKSWDEILGPLGIDTSDLPDTRVQVESGEDWFAQQPEAVQREKLGPAKYALYADGQLQLSDLVGQTPDGYVYEKSLRELGYSSAQVTRLVKQGSPAAHDAAATTTANAAVVAGHEAVVATGTAARGLGTVEEIQARESQMKDVFDSFTDATFDKQINSLRNRMLKDPDFEAVVKAIIPQSVFDVGRQIGTSERTLQRDVYQQAITNLIREYHTYAGESSSARPLQIALQEAAAREFGLSAHAVYSSEARDAALAQYGDALPGMQKLLRAVYSDTQKWFDKQGITEVQVFRGMKWTEGQQPAGISFDDSVRASAVPLQALSSFTTSADQALGYATGGRYSSRGDYGMVLADTVPVERIFSTGFQGFGAPYMQEVLLLGSNEDRMLAQAMTTPGAEARQIFNFSGTGDVLPSRPQYSVDDLYRDFSQGSSGSQSSQGATP